MNLAMNMLFAVFVFFGIFAGTYLLCSCARDCRENRRRTKDAARRVLRRHRDEEDT